MSNAIIQIAVGVCASSIIALVTWAIGIHSQLIELKTWKEIFEEQSRNQYRQIYELLTEVREDIKNLRKN